MLQGWRQWSVINARYHSDPCFIHPLSSVRQGFLSLQRPGIYLRIRSEALAQAERDAKIGSAVVQTDLQYGVKAKIRTELVLPDQED